MNFYDILFQQQNAEKVPYSKSYFDTLFAQKFSNIKTLTGTLPLTFTTSETKLRSWTIYGADIEHEKSATGKSINFYTDENKLRDWTIYGNNDVGKNKLELTAETQTISGVTWTVDKIAGTVTASGQATDSNNTLRLYIPVATEDRYLYFSGAPHNSNSAQDWYMICWDETNNARCKLWDGSTPPVTQSEIDNRSPEGTFLQCLIPANHTCRLNLRIFTIAALDNVVFTPMLRPADTTADFEPYQQGIGKKTENGYIVPVQSGGVTTNVFIGSDPLTAGESVSKTSTGVDIATTDGNNTITTSLYNQPDMSITYNEFTGVGLFVGNMFIIALQLKAGGSTLNVFSITLNKPLRAGETLTSEQTGETIQTVAGVENKLTPSPKAASYGGSFSMKIKYKE